MNGFRWTDARVRVLAQISPAMVVLPMTRSWSATHTLAVSLNELADSLLRTYFEGGDKL